MGIRVALQREDGSEIASVEDDRNLLHGTLPGPAERFVWASTIDPYGDTVFNHLQVERLRPEWEQLIRQASDAQISALLHRIKELLDQCSEHRYLKFYGD